MLIKTKKTIYKLLLALWAAILLLSSYAVIGSAMFQYQEKKIFKNVSNIVKATALILDSEDIKILIDKLDFNENEEYNKSIEQTEEYINIKKKLISIKSAFSENVGTLYIIVEYKDQQAIIVASDEEDSFGYIIDISEWPIMQEALYNKKSLTEEQFYYDPEYDKKSISSYSVILDNNGEYIALLGLDYFEYDYLKETIMYRVLPIFPSISIAILLFFIPLISIKIIKIKFYL